MLFKAGLLCFALGVLMFAVWGVCSTMIVQHFNPMNAERIVDGATYTAPFFQVPTALLVVVGLVLAIFGYTQESRKT